MRIVGMRFYLKARWDRDHQPERKVFRYSQPSLRPRVKMHWLDVAKRNAKADVFRLRNRYLYPWGGSVYPTEKKIAETAKHFR